MSSMVEPVEQPVEQAAAPRERGPGRGGLARLLEEAPALMGLEPAALERSGREGLAFYEQYNSARQALALGMFDEPMRHAIFELLFLLHRNDPSLAEWSFPACRYVTEGSARRRIETPSTIDLYVEGAPSGVRGMRALSPLLREDYERYVARVFRMDPYGEPDAPAEYPIAALQAVGSTGTIGQKPGESDLDLQVIYETSPFAHNTSEWNDALFGDALNREYRVWLNHFGRERKLTPEALRDPVERQKLAALASKRVSQSYPYLYRALTEKDRAFAEDLVRTQDAALRARVLREMFALMKRAGRVSNAMRGRETLLKRRIQRIQEYIDAKFPEAEIYLFVYTVEHFRSGVYDSTLEFKESSGSAYEFILNYETLMPGVQFTPPVPTHFLLPQHTNDEPGAYGDVVDALRFHALPGLAAHAERLVDLGATTRLDTTYIARHGGAIYWEAFKASSGNLPKATLNLLRFEMLLDPRFLQTIIHMIKDPGRLDALAAPRPEGDMAMLRYESQLGQMKTGLASWAVLDLESRFPALRQDPWWLRYKGLKIAFEEAGGIEGIEPEERRRLSNVIDLCFALHLRISDVLNQEEAGREKPSFREEVLAALLEAAFPPGSPRRIHLENLLTGDARGLIRFENEMRDLFQRSMTRVEKKMAALGVRDHAGKKEEVDLWLNYYLENFQPQGSVVPRAIMKHLKVARAGIEIHFRPESGWVFMSIQRVNRTGLPPRRPAKVSYLPERLTLFETPSFLTGLAHCIVNGYIGAVRDESGAGQHTVIRIERQRTVQDRDVHNRLAWVGAEQVDRLAQRIAAFFPYQYVDYRAIIRAERRITDVFVCLNLFRFGRLSIVYRNSINTWFCEEIDLPELPDQVEALTADLDALLEAEPVHRRLTGFFREHKIDPARVSLGVWANPNSFTAGHAKEYHALMRDLEEGRRFRERILLHQGVRTQPPPAPRA